MVIPITTLWLPILVSAVLVFFASFLLNAVLTIHKNDFRAAPDEDRVMDALRPFNLPPGDYILPYVGHASALKSEGLQQKIAKGPIGALTIYPPNVMFNMGSQLAQWFAYTLLVGIVAAYLAGRVLTEPAVDYLQVFRVTGTVAFACYSMALMQRSIWYMQNWPMTLRHMFDGLIYALLTAGAFGWLWPA
jgi:hypothetical protein